MNRPQTCLVTGATSGIGLATAIELARRGAKVLVHGRTLEKAERAREQIAARAPGARLDVVSGDLSSLAEVRAMADDVRARFPDLTVLVNNAGEERWERHVTAEGFEETWAVNHLAPFLLSLRLVDVLRANAPTRIVDVSSVVHRWGHLDWDDLQMAHGYGPERAYYRSKLASLMTSLELARRVERDGISVLFLAPGLVRTEFGRDFRGFARWWSHSLGRVLFRRPQVVARELAELALGEQWSGRTGVYVSRGRVEPPAHRATDEASQRRLWEISTDSVGLPAELVPAPSARRPTVAVPSRSASPTA